MPAQLTDVVYAERMGIGGKVTVQEIVDTKISWFDHVVGNTSFSVVENSETLFGFAGISTEIVYKGITYKRFDLNDDSQSYILTTGNTVITQRY